MIREMRDERDHATARCGPVHVRRTSSRTLGAKRTRPAAPSTPAVRELLTDRCLACHSPEVKKGGLDLSRRASALAGGKNGPAVVAGKAEESLLIERLDAGEMPPDRPLGPEQVAALRAWVDRGAPYGDGPPLAPTRRPRLVVAPADPPPRGPGRPECVLGPNAGRRLRPRPARSGRVRARPRGRPRRLAPPGDVRPDRPPAPPRGNSRLRRGRIRPTPTSGSSTASSARPITASAGGGTGSTSSGSPRATGTRRTSCGPTPGPTAITSIRAFNRDIPSPGSSRTSSPETRVDGGDWLARSATGFLVGGAHDVVGNQTVEGSRQQRADDLDDMITAAGTAFLGLTVHCARCHDHKFDPVTQRDYYGLQAVFAGVQHAEREVPTPEAADLPARDRGGPARDRPDRRELDAFEPLARTDASSPRPPSDQPAPERRSVRAGRRPGSSGSTSRPRRRSNPASTSFKSGRRARARATSRWPARGQARVVLELRGQPVPQARTSQRRPIRQLVELDLGGAGEGLGAGRAAGSRHDRPRRLGPGPRGEVRGPAGDALHRSRSPPSPAAGRSVASSADRLRTAEARPAGPEVAALLKRREGGARAARRAGSRGSKVYAGTFTEPGPTRLLRRGDPMQPGDEVPPAAVKAVRAGLPGADRRDRGRAAPGAGAVDRATPRTRCRPG